MAIDYMYIGESPCDEPCAQLGKPGYIERARAECAAFIEAIRRKLGEEPAGAHLSVKREAHEYGTYLTVVCRYDDNDEKAIEYAFRCEAEAPRTWAEVGMTPPTLADALAA